MALSVKLLGGGTLTSTLSTIYTVPASTTARIAHIVLSNGGTAGTFTIEITDTSDSSATYNLHQSSAIGANETLHLYDINLEAGDILKASAATTTGCDITVHGTEET